MNVSLSSSYVRSMDSNGGGVITTITYPDQGTRVTTNNVDGTVKSITGTGVHGVSYSYGVNMGGGRYVIEYKLTNETLSSEWTRSVYDALGRMTNVEYNTGVSHNPYTLYSYNARGQLWKTMDPDKVITLYIYNAKGEREYTILPSTGNFYEADLATFAAYSSKGSISDRITQTQRSYTKNGTGDYRSRVDTFVWNDGASSGTLVSRAEGATSGLTNWNSVYTDGATPSTTISMTQPGISRVVTITAPDNSYVKGRYDYGRLTAVNRYSSNDAVISATSYAYDPHGRQWTVTDARNGTTSYTYNNADLVESITTPDPQVMGSGPQTTTTYYNNMLQATSVVYADGGVVNNLYHLTGELKQTSGSRTYPVGYGYDYAGRMQYMTNWSGFARFTGARVTRWNYDPYRGWLNSKDYPDPTTGNPLASAGTTGPVYTYTSGGRLKTRTWLRGTVSTYRYGFEGTDTKHGDLVSVTYTTEPNGMVTPSVTNTYDRRGRVSTVACNGMTNTMVYDGANELLSETYTGTNLNGISVVSAYDPAKLRRDSLTLKNGGTALDSWSYGYDNASRLQTVSERETNTATYGYLANSPLVQNVVFTNNGTNRMTTVKTYDMLNRLQSISSTPTGAPAISDAYGYNSANQRISSTLADGSYWVYQYDSDGQVTAGKKHWSDGTLVEGQQFEYVQDDIGNRTSTKTGGDASGGTLRPKTYTANFLNQYSSRSALPFLDVTGMGISNATVAVTVNGQTANRKGEYFRSEVRVNNNTAPVWQNISVAEAGQTTNSGYAFFAQNPEYFTNDVDGNLISDGRWTYAWDAENRLVSLTARTSVGPQQLIKFEYDSNGRRIHKQVWNNTNGTGTAAVDQRFVYDGWNPIAILNTNLQLNSSFTWGLDLSGSLQGAGGVGGLLWVYDTATLGSPSSHYATFDGNGNVTGLINASSGANSATYEYGPFGEVIRATGPMAKANPFRFSTKYTDDESDLVYYGYRYYNPSTGRLLSRDPLNELGSKVLCNRHSKFSRDAEKILYAFWENDPVDNLDALGLQGTIAGGPTGPAWGGWGTPPASRTPSPEPPNEGFKTASDINGYTGLTLTVIENGSGEATIGSNLKIYPNGWGGGSRARICTVKIEGIAHDLGPLGFIVGTGIDGAQWIYGDMSGGKFFVNTTMGVVGLEGGPIGAAAGGLYFLFDGSAGEHLHDFPIYSIPGL